MKFSTITFHLLLLATICLVGSATSLPCSPKDFGKSSIVCVCNSTYCDTQEPFSNIQLQGGQYYHVVSTKAGKRFDSNVVTIRALMEEDGNEIQEEEPVRPLAAQLVIDRQVQHQTMIGFGAAFTDAGGFNMNEMSEQLRDNILNAYFNEEGLEYTVQRVPIGGTDFSVTNYTLCDEQGPEDNLLEHFNLTVAEDFGYKIPYIKRAQQIQPNLKLFASPWSAPPWMKTNGDIRGGQLKQEYYPTWADYFVKFLDGYKAENLTFWGITIQNEPIHGTLIGGEWNSMGWWAANQRDFIKYNFGPTLADAGYGDVKLMIVDDQRFQVVHFTRTILSDSAAAKYVSGIGLHWYSNFYIPPFVLDTAHNEYPQYFMINTEACTGYLHFLPGVERVVLGSWERAEYYAHNIIEDLNHWLSGWVEWNLVLDMDGGPNWAHNEVDSPVIFDRSIDEAYKQPMYYALGHFSKYIPEGSIRINHTVENIEHLEILTVLRPDNNVVAVIYNPRNNIVALNIQDSEGGSISIAIEPKSINTVIYSNLTSTNPNPPSTTPNAAGSILHSPMNVLNVLSSLCLSIMLLWTVA